MNKINHNKIPAHLRHLSDKALNGLFYIFRAKI